MKFIKKENDKIFFEIEGKTFSRKLTQKNTFNFNKKKYFYFQDFEMGYGDKKFIYEVTEKMEKAEKEYAFTWFGLDRFICDIVNDYKFLENETKRVPSAPNTSIFSVIKEGFVRSMREPETFGVNQYSMGTYIHKAIQFGENIDYKEVLPILRYIMPMFAEKLSYGNSKKTIKYEEAHGSSFSTFGIG